MSYFDYCRHRPDPPEEPEDEELIEAELDTELDREDEDE
jgi:hypothetical protein